MSTPPKDHSALSARQVQTLAADIFDESFDDTVGDGARLLPNISGFRVIRSLGTGGMSTVYEAEQTMPRRTVAIKVLDRAGPFRGRGRSAVHRFRLESNILAQLNHPAIAQVYEAGMFDDGAGDVPYFVMELVPGGQPITDFAQSHDLALDARLRLFADVCDAVHHGHQKGIIHRDLKPTNVLIDHGGKPKVIDFGVARAADSDIAVTTLNTEFGQLIGTLQYMSPEQCDGDPDKIDTRSDVYALGVMLYELVCERVPYDLSHMSLPTATRMIHESEPPAPGGVNRRLRGDIEAIVLKALAKDREKRYGSAADLAQDVRRHLAGEPIEARRPGRWMRTIRWLGAHPILSTSIACAAIVAATIFGTTVVAQWLHFQPVGFNISPDRRYATLVSRAGTILAELGGAGAECRVMVAAAVDRPEKYGGGKVSLVCVSGATAANSTGGQLWMCDLSDLSSPLWQTRADLTAPPLPDDQEPDDSYEVSKAIVADVFPELEGDEIIVLHSHHCCSSFAVRIYDFAGNVHYEAWHLGPIYDIHWMEDPGVLIAIGDRHSALGNPSKLGLHHVGRYAKFLCALRPTLGKKRGWISDDRDRRVADVAWYKWLMPPESWDQFGVPPQASLAPSSHVQFQGPYFCAKLYLLAHDAGGITWCFRHDGEVQTILPTDPYPRLLREEKVPAIDQLHWPDEPPVARQANDEAAGPHPAE